MPLLLYCSMAIICHYIKISQGASVGAILFEFCLVSMKSFCLVSMKEHFTIQQKAIQDTTFLPSKMGFLIYQDINNTFKSFLTRLVLFLRVVCLALSCFLWQEKERKKRKAIEQVNIQTNQSNVCFSVRNKCFFAVFIFLALFV